METITLELPVHKMTVESREVAITVDLGELPHDILRQIIPHGIKQKLADAAASVPFTCYMAAKPEGTPKPSRDQLTDFVAANKATVDAGILAAMQKAWDAMVAGQIIQVGADRTGHGPSQKVEHNHKVGLADRLMSAASRAARAKDVTPSEIEDGRSNTQ